MVPSRPHGAGEAHPGPGRSRQDASAGGRHRAGGAGAGPTAPARAFTWYTTPPGTLEVMQRTIEAERPRLRGALRRAESGKAAGLAVATLVQNAIQLLVTVVFTR